MRSITALPGNAAARTSSSIWWITSVPRAATGPATSRWATTPVGDWRATRTSSGLTKKSPQSKRKSTPPAWNWKRLKISTRRIGTTCCSTGQRSCSNSTISKPLSATSGRRAFPFSATTFPSPAWPAASKAGSHAAKPKRWAWRARRQTVAQRHGVEHGL